MQPNYYPNAPGHPSYQSGGNEKRSRRRSLSVDMTEEDITKDDFDEFLDRLSEVPSPRKSPSTERPTRKRSRQSKEYHHHDQARYFQPQFETPVVRKASPKSYERSEDAQFLASDLQSLTPSPVNHTPIDQSHSRADVDGQHQDGNNGGFWQSSTFGGAGYNNQAPLQAPSGLSYTPDPADSSPTERATPSYYFGH